MKNPVFRIRDTDLEGKNDPLKKKKILVLKCWMFYFEADGFFCSLEVLYRGLGIG